MDIGDRALVAGERGVDAVDLILDDRDGSVPPPNRDSIASAEPFVNRRAAGALLRRRIQKPIRIFPETYRRMKRRLDYGPEVML